MGRLPPLRVCQERIRAFDRKYPRSSFNAFWQYKTRVERRGDSILDDSHLDDTVTRLVRNLLLHDEWDLWKTGVTSFERIGKILKNISGDYETIKDIQLGDGQVAYANPQAALARIYANFHMPTEDCGITHNCWERDAPDRNGGYYIVGRSKVLMFIWGQTPGFDTRVRGSIDLPGFSSQKRRYTPSQFCGALKELDHRVLEWNKEQQRQGTMSQKFRDFYPIRGKLPIGRIIDMIYW